MDRKKWLWLIIILLIILGLIIFAVAKTGDKDSAKENETKTEESSELTPEEVLQGMDEGVEEVSGPVEIKIISPEGDTFVPRQARMWKAQIENLSLTYPDKATCDWKFYLNEYSEEVLYKEQSTQVTPDNDGTGKICAFTSTFIENRGELRVVVDLKVERSNGTSIDEYSGTRYYTVK